MNPIQIEEISKDNLISLTKMGLKLWPDFSFEIAKENYTRILNTKTETCFLANNQNDNIAFIQLSLRSDFVEGTTTSPVGYIEGIYVDSKFRNQRIGSKLIQRGEIWSKEMGCQEYASDAELSNKTSIEFHEKYGFKLVNQVACFAKKIS